MSRLTLRLPESLHRRLEALAENEQISLNQYIVYALTQQVTIAYTVQPLPATIIAEQRAAYTALLQRLGQASFKEVERVLAEREPVELESGLTPEVMTRLQERIARQHSGS